MTRRTVTKALEELDHWNAIRGQLEKHDLDLRTLMDTLEGCTELHEALVAVDAAVAELDALLVATKALLTDTRYRVERLEKRRQMLRGIMEMCMAESGIKTISGPTGTISLATRQPVAIVIDGHEIPAEYYVQQPPKLNKQKLTEDLRNGKNVSGAQLSNAGLSLTVRRK